MFRSKIDVDRHVTDILSKIHNENEKNLRGYHFARLYYQVKDYEVARKYLSLYLSVRDHHAPSHKLLAQIYEATGNPEKALQSYKRSLEVDGNQKDTVLKICELYCCLPVDHETARYWADRADQLFPHNDIVFRLRECIVNAEGEPDRKDLENLISNELAAQPLNLNLRIKLLHLYLDTERVKEAYEHATKVERKRPFPYSTEWYYMLVNVFEAYQNEAGQELDSNFYIMFLTALDHLVYLTLAEPHALFEKEESRVVSHLEDAAGVLLQFDQHLKKASDKDLKHGPWLYFLHHMKGQLYYHMGTLLLKRAKKVRYDQGNWKEVCRIGTALFLIGYSFKPANLLQEIWFSQMDEQQKLFTKFFQEGALRTSFIGHTVNVLCEEEKSKWLQKIKLDVCLPQVQSRTYNRLFSCTNQKWKSSDSYFLNDNTFINSSLEFPTAASLLEYDEAAFKLCPHSLHHLVWLQLHKESNENVSFRLSLYEAFKGVQFSNNNLSKGSPESLCLLDLEAFLVATVYTTNLLLEQKNAVMKNRNNDIPLCLPPDIADRLCTQEQACWWKAAYGLVSNSIKEKLGEQRRILQRGLEVIRGIGNHGLEVQLLVHLARTFADRASMFHSDDDNSSKNNSDVIVSDKFIGLETRALHYWNIVLNMLDKIESNQTLRIPKDRMFVGMSKNLSNDEITTLREEGNLYLACRFMNSGKLEKAIELLEKLSSPFAKYYLALTYKKLALQKSTSAVARKALLEKAYDAFYVTSDLIKNDEKHSLNNEIHFQIEDITNIIVNQVNYDNANENSENEGGDSCDAVDFSFRSYKDEAPLSANLNRIAQPKHSTPRPSPSFMTPRSKYQTNTRTHVEPSPERLDAQIRSIVLSQSTLVKTLAEQQRSLLDSNKAMVEQLKQNTEVLTQLTKKLEELQIPNSKNHRPSGRKPVPSRAAAGGHGDEERSDEDAEYEPNGYLDYYVDENAEEFRHAGYGYGHSARPVDHPAGPPMGYVPPGALPPAHYAYQYPPPPPHHHGLAPPPPPPPPPPGPIPDQSHYYHTPLNHGLPFSEGQPLPQFRFHVATPIAKPAVMVSVASLPPPLPPPVMPQPSIPTVIPPTSQAPMPWTKPGAIPHAFQIPMPAATTAALTMSQSTAVVSPSVSSTMPSSVSTSATPPAFTKSPPSDSRLKALLSGTPASTILGITPQVPSITTSGFSFSTPVSTSSPEVSTFNRSRQDSEACSDTDVEREVMGDFKPAIPLPAEVIVETGEEEEEVLFEDRAKLFRFADREWKERGVGTVKILKHKVTGKIRLLMRRDQVLKVCANHQIASTMEIKYFKGSDKALTWAAQDFADESVKLEQFCIRFKTPEIADAFKKSFEGAIQFLKSKEKSPSSIDVKPVVNGIIDNAVNLASPSFGSNFLPKAGYWSCSTCYVYNDSSRKSCEACESSKPGLSKSTEPTSSSRSPFSLVSPASGIAPSLSSSSAENSSSKPVAVYGSPNANKTIQRPEATTNNTVKSNLAVTQPSSSSMPSAFGGFSFASPAVISKKLTSDNKESESGQSSTVISKTQSLSSEPKTVFSNFSFSPPKLSSGAEKGKSEDLAWNKLDKPIASVGGFTFSTVPVVAEKTLTEPQDREILVVSTKSKEGPQVTKIESSKSSPFYGFSFKADFSNKPSLSEESKSAVDTTSISPPVFSPPTSKGSVPKSDSPSMAGGSLIVTVTKEGRRVSGEYLENTPEEFVPTAEFKPVVPLPALVEVKTGEEGEEKLFGERAKLFRYDTEGKEWKERGIGELKILHSEKDNKNRILMRRDQVLKICANHYILPQMKLIQHSNDKTWAWLAQDFSEGDLRQEQFAARFKTREIAQQFCEVFEACRLMAETKKSDDKPSDVTNDNQKESKGVSDSCAGNQNSFSEMFFPKPNSWECPGCYIRNEDTNSSCIACQTVKPDFLKSSKVTEQSKTDLDYWSCPACWKKVNGTVCSCGTPKSGVVKAEKKVSFLSDDSSKPLSELCKADPSLWECTTCYVRNDKNSNSCIACQTAKTGSNVQIPSTMSSGFSDAFKFNTTTSNTSESKFVFGSGPAKVNNSGFIFGVKSTEATASPAFKFGVSGSGFKPDLSKTESTPNNLVFGGTPLSTQATSTLMSLSQNRPGLSITPVTAAPTFVFGKPATSVSSSNSDLSANSSGVPINKASGFRFGAATESNDSQQKEEDGFEFRFGSPQKYEFNFSGVRPRSPSKSVKSPKSPGTPTDVEDDDEVEPSDVDNIYFQPVIPLPPKVEVKTGEEDETALFTSRAKLYRFVDDEWKERGIGDVKILHNPTQNTVRLLMRREQVLKVCLNHFLTKDISFSWKGEKSLTWAAADYSENEPNLELFAIRFKTAELAQKFLDTVNCALGILDSKTDNKPASITASSTETKMATPTTVVASDSAVVASDSVAEKLSSFSFSLDNMKPKMQGSAFDLSSRLSSGSSKGSYFDSLCKGSMESSQFSFTSPTKDTDAGVEVVFEAKATPEQIAAAEKLMLPRNFYLYENKPPCPGCRGCTEDVPIQYKKVEEISEESQDATKVDATASSTTDVESLFPHSSLTSVSFADLSKTKTGFEVLGSVESTNRTFPGAGQKLFGNVTSTEDDDGEVTQSPDVHFEPIIPLPDLVDVQTGEEDETTIFCQRAKLYRFDTNSGQWKERGVGELKILKHKEKCRFRILLRRDQVFKVACNHLISEGIELMPMKTSENSLCWNAVDFSEGRSDHAKFAVRFKNKEILQEFRTKFEECKGILGKQKNNQHGDETVNTEPPTAIPEKNVPEPIVAAVDTVTSQIVASVNVSPSSTVIPIDSSASGSVASLATEEAVSAVKGPIIEEVQQSHEYSEEDDGDDDEDEDDEDIMFDKRVSFEVFNEATNKFEGVGLGSLQVMYDDTVYGYRIQVLNDNNQELMSDHIIAIQTCLRTENKSAIWAAIDISIDPPKRRQFRATFSSKPALNEFAKIFAEGKQVAFETEIVEKSENPVLSTHVDN